MPKNDATVLLRTADALIHELSLPLADTLEQFPVDAHVRHAAAHDSYEYCESTPPKQAAQWDRILQLFGTEKALAYNRLALVAQVRTRLAAPRDEIVDLSIEWFARMLDDAREKSLAYYDPAGADNMRRSDLAKDFAVATNRAIPIGGAWIVERRRHRRDSLFNPRVEGGHRSLTILRHVKQAIDQLRGAYGSYFVIHTAYRYRRWFTETHMNAAYATLARLLERDADVEGIYRRSWFLDPEVSSINPRLAFLLEVPRDHGAEVRRCGPLPQGERPEIAGFSKARREQLEGGKYVPTEWAYLWLREDVLRWYQNSI